MTAATDGGGLWPEVAGPAGPARLPTPTGPPAPPRDTVCTTAACRARIRLVTLDTGAVTPIDPEPREDGNLVWRRIPDLGWFMHVLRDADDPAEMGSLDGRRWVTHFATCARPDDHRTTGRGRGGRASGQDTTAVGIASAKPASRPGRHLSVVTDPPTGGVLLAVDGNSLAHRAFHAYEKSAMASPDGRPLWAVYGFLVLLAGIIDRTRPDAVVVGFDDRAGSRRRDQYPGYKAQRSQKSPDLYTQLDDIAATLADLGVAVVVPPGLEADDVLASAAQTAQAAGWRCVAATSDKDAFALITDTTTVLRLVSGLANAELLTPPDLVAQYGVTPGQWRDYTALVGDPSDNLPGVLGVGPKSAVKLLAGCGTLDAALSDPAAAVAAAGKAAAGKLATDQAREAIDRNRALMAAVGDVPVDLAGCRPAVPAGTVAAVLRARHLPSLVDRVTAALCRPPPPAAPPSAAVEPGPVRRPRAVPPPAASAVSSFDPKRVVPDRSRLLPIAASPATGPTLTCPQCGAACPGRIPTVAGGSALIEGDDAAGDLVAVLTPAGYAVRPRADSDHTVDVRGGRLREHWCRPPLPPCSRCDGPGGRLRAGGVICAACVARMR